MFQWNHRSRIYTKNSSRFIVKYNGQKFTISSLEKEAERILTQTYIRKTGDEIAEKQKLGIDEQPKYKTKIM